VSQIQLASQVGKTYRKAGIRNFAIRFQSNQNRLCHLFRGFTGQSRHLFADCKDNQASLLSWGLEKSVLIKESRFSTVDNFHWRRAQGQDHDAPNGNGGQEMPGLPGDFSAYDLSATAANQALE
jgi:hypothetical protein